MKSLLGKIRNFVDRLPVDNKLIAGGAAYVLTYIVGRAGLKLEDVVVPPAVTISQLIAFAAAGIAGYFTSNEATVMRNAEKENGNPDPALLAQHGVEVKNG